MPNYFDAHSHLQFPQYDDDRDAVLQRMEERGVWTLTVGTNLETSKEAIAFAKDKNGVSSTVGLHPNDTDKEQFDKEVFRALLVDEKVVAVGECGLDYYRNDPEDAEMKKRQQEQFEQQIEFSIAHELPLMLHCRPSRGTMDAYKDTIAILRQFPKARGNVHFFVGDRAVAKGFLELGFTMSFTGVLTFARDYDEVVRYIPLESVLTETDAPFAAPLPHRGKRNEPSYVVEVVRAIAQIRKENEEAVRAEVAKNAARLFQIKS